MMLTMEGTPIEKAQLLAQYVDGCLDAYPVKETSQQEHGKDGVQSKCVAAATAVHDMLGRMVRVRDSVLCVALVKGELKQNENLQKLLPPRLLGLSSLIETDWTDLMTTLESEETDLASFFPKIQKYESAKSLADGKSELQKDDPDLFGDLVTSCKAFVEMFGKNFEKAMQATSECTLPKFLNFIEKYKEVEACAETWQMEPAQWIFNDDMEDDVQKDIKEMKDARDDMLGLVSKMKEAFHSFSRTSQCVRLKGLLEKCRDVAEEIGSKADRCAFIASVILFSHGILKESGVEEIKRVEKFVKKSFGPDFLPSILPKALHLKVNELLAKPEKKPKGDKLDKKNKKDKTEKDSEKHSSKRSASAADEPAGKPKKSKK